MFLEYIKIIEEYLYSKIKPCNELFEAMNYSLTAGGKRIRPLLTLLCCEALGEDIKKSLPFAAAVEMVHTYSLIHDDLPAMDDDDLRRGRPTCHKKYDEATAILAGDGLLTLAFEIIADSFIEADKIVSAVKILSHAAGPYGMVWGQVCDTLGKTQTAEDILYMYDRKTGDLLSSASALGAIAAGGKGNEFNDFSRNLGAAFQIRDDILDIEGNKNILGKPINSDIKNDKTTFIRVVGMEKAKKLVEEFSDKAITSLDFLGTKGESLRELAKLLINREV